MSDTDVINLTRGVAIVVGLTLGLIVILAAQLRSWKALSKKQNLEIYALLEKKKELEEQVASLTRSRNALTQRREPAPPPQRAADPSTFTSVTTTARVVVPAATPPKPEVPPKKPRMKRTSRFSRMEGED